MSLQTGCFLKWTATLMLWLRPFVNSAVIGMLSTAGLMIGNAKDLIQMIDWIHEFWSEEQGLYGVFPEASLVRAAQVIKDLYAAFDNAEQAHRRAFHLIGAKKEQIKAL
ncbi:hypothetical protein BDV40DRAFT_306774 [Aspergillus tamarii]|uniref:Uncharacterized protein n=1 Tax=Aspergillus tamarii TaxID=41984 RepID=A0A5N6UAQ8_ASPTM|nr:hypothetical protein BDV40DRAFT_306774 [Aspergillus tamarii]